MVVSTVVDGLADQPGKRNILITGSGSGIGRDTAVALARRGHRVLATTHTHAEAEEMSELSARLRLPIESFKLDVTAPDDRNRIVGLDLDVLINNAGTGESGSLAEIDVDRVRHNFEVNVFGPLSLTQLALRRMVPMDRGTVIFISSLAGRITMPFLGPYSMTKFSLSGGIDALRQELSKIDSNVHVVLVEPGSYHTGFNQENIAKKYEWMGETSYFYQTIDRIRSDEERYFRLLEVRSTDSIVRKIVRAAEARKPRFRYVAPWWQGALVQLARTFGK